MLKCCDNHSLTQTYQDYYVKVNQRNKRLKHRYYIVHSYSNLNINLFILYYLLNINSFLD